MGVMEGVLLALSQEVEVYEHVEAKLGSAEECLV